VGIFPMAMEDAIPDPTALELFVKIRFGWLVSRALHAAAELGVADLLSDGAKTSDQIAVATNTHPQSLYRLLRMLAAHEVFEEDAAGRFHLTPVGSLLRTGALRDATRMLGDADSSIGQAWRTKSAKERSASSLSSIFS
jgi:hypothetical protein